MKIYLETDVEGVAEVTDPDSLYNRDNPEFLKNCQRLTAEVNAFIEVAFEHGAEEIVVHDGHAGGRNLLDEQVDSRAQIVRGAHPWDTRFDAAAMVGQHAMAGALQSWFPHTQSPRDWFEYTLGGKPYGELGQFAVHAGAYEIPFFMLTGDRAACIEAKEFIPGITTCEVKSATQTNKGPSLSLEESCLKIKETYPLALKNLKNIKPYNPGFPTEVSLTFYSTEKADEVEDFMNQYEPGCRINGRTFKKTAKSHKEIYFITWEGDVK